MLPHHPTPDDGAQSMAVGFRSSTLAGVGNAGVTLPRAGAEPSKAYSIQASASRECAVSDAAGVMLTGSGFHGATTGEEVALFGPDRDNHGSSPARGTFHAGGLARRQHRGEPPVGDAQYDALPLLERRRVAVRLAVMARADAQPEHATQVMRRALLEHDGEQGLSLKRLQNLRTLWRTGQGELKAGDWRLLVDRRAAGKGWWNASENVGLPAEFVAAVRELFAENKRNMSPACRKLAAWWHTGLRRRGVVDVREPIPGYGFRQEWLLAGGVETKAGVPRGWSQANLRTQCRLTELERAVAHVGVAEAAKVGPTVLGTRAGTRFLERVFFDDVKCDFRVFDPASGQVVDLWLLVAMDYASAAFLGFWMRPATVDYKGQEEHLRLRDMIHFSGWLLETYGLPARYAAQWKVENGTATFTDACAEALGGLFGQRLTVSYARMIGGKSGVGYQETAGGNSRAKAPLESAFNLLHNECADLPGQTGRRWEVRPADLAGREKAALAVARTFAEEESQVRQLMRLPLLTVPQARMVLNHIFRRINARTEHALEGFGEVLEWRMALDSGLWLPIASLPRPEPFGCQIRQRRQSPWERLTELRLSEPWEAVPQAALTLFYATTQRFVEVNAAGEIEFTHEKRDLVFRAPEGTAGIAPGTRLLAYFCPQEPQFLHLTRRAPHQGYVATWTRRVRIALHDHEGLTREMEYTQTALKAARDAVAGLQAGERLQLEEMAAHNDAVLEEAKARRQAIDAVMGDEDGACVSRPSNPGDAEAVTVTVAGLARARGAVAQAPAVKRAAADLVGEADAALSKLI